MAPDRTLRARIALMAVLSLGLSGCIDTLEPGSGPRRPFVNAQGVSVALVSLDGAPEAVTQRFEAELGKEAGRRQITLVQGSEAPRYKLKGYLSAYDVEGGTSVSWVWDMYDTTEKRARRVDGAQLVRRNAAEPWSTVDDALLQAAASSSMNEVASYLAGSPSPSAESAQATVAQARIAQAQLPPIQSARSQVEQIQAARVARPPAASNRSQPDSDKTLPNTGAFAATFDLPSGGGGRSGPTPALGLLPR